MVEPGLFDDDKLDHHAIAQHLDDLIDEDTDGKKWPQGLAEMVDILKRSCEELGMDEPKALDVALNLAFKVCDNLGGMQFYLPNGRYVKNFIRDIKIWNEHTGNNVLELSKKYDLTEVRIFQILKAQRKLHIKKIQPDIFGGNHE